MASPSKVKGSTVVNGAKKVRKEVAIEQMQSAAADIADTNTAMEEKSASILELAHAAVNGSRQENYGDQLQNFQNIADIWTVVLREKLVTPITPQDVAMCQVGLKLARLTKTGGWHKDSVVDIAGYAECLGVINGI